MASEIKVDTISEKTSAGGVTIDSVKLKDGGIVISDAANIGSSSDTDALAISSGGVVTFSQNPVFPDGGVAIADLDIDGGTDIGAAIVDADLFIVDDGAGGTNRKVTASRIKTYAGTSSIGDITDVSMDATNFVDSFLIQPDSDGSAPTTGTLSSATGNVGIGKDVFASLTSGTKNVVFGYNAGDALQGAADNVIIGNEAGTDLTSANNNTFIGRGAGASITTGGSNVAIGHDAYNGCDAEQKNIAIGQDALGGAIAGGEYNIGIGVEAGLAVTSADGVVLMGYQAGDGLTTGGYNTLVGYQAGDGLTTGSSNVCVGKGTDTNANDDVNAITIGDGITSGTNNFSFGKGSNVVSNDFSSNANWSRSSDVRKKREIYNQGLGLDFINDLRTVNFKWKPSNEFPKEWNDYSEENNMDTDVIMHGFIAQEVKESLDKHANDIDKKFGGWSEGVDGMQHTSREMFVIPLIKAVQELSAQVTTLKDEINTLKGG